MYGVSVDFPRQLKCCCNACRSLAVFLLNLAFAQHAVSKLQPTAFVLLDDKLRGVLRCFPARMPDKSGDCPFVSAHADASVNMDFGHSLAVVAHRPRNGEWANYGHARQKQLARLCVFQCVRHIRQGSALQDRRRLNPRGKVSLRALRFVRRRRQPQQLGNVHRLPIEHQPRLRLIRRQRSAHQRFPFA